jgi:integrase
MSVHQKKDGRWIAVWYDPESKKQRNKVFGRGDLAQIRAEKFDLEKKAEKGKARTDGLTVAELIQAYQIDHFVRESTARMDHYIFPRIAARMGAIQADLLNSTHLTKYVEKRLKDGVTKTVSSPKGPIRKADHSRSVKRTTIGGDIRRLKAVYSWACNQEPPLITHNPIVSFKIGKLEAPDVPAPPTVEEIKAILDQAEPHLARAITIFWYSGIRPATEMYNIRWRDVDLSRDNIRITSAQKGAAAYRNIPIEPPLKESLGKWLKEDIELFGDKLSNRPLVHYRREPVLSLKKSWASAKTAAKITRRIRLYDIRHAFASIALEEGADLKSLSEILGHSRPDTTLRSYQHVTRKQHRQVIAKIPTLK